MVMQKGGKGIFRHACLFYSRGAVQVAMSDIREDQMRDDRIDELLVKQELYELACTYMRGLDRLRRDLVRGVFHEDAVCNYGFFVGGPDQFADFAMEALSGHKANHHFIGNTLYEVDGNEAYGEVYFQAYHRIVEDGEDKDLFISGRYVDRYERRLGLWRMAYRAEVNDWARTVPAADEFFASSPDGLRGSRQDDLVFQRDKMR